MPDDMSNEDLLREGECPQPNCIEPAGHPDPHSGDVRRRDGKPTEQVEEKEE